MSEPDPIPPPVPVDPSLIEEAVVAAITSNTPPVQPRKPGIRIGPMTFVPEFSHRAGYDPWAHRKGEPRIFALLWSVYLMFSALGTIFAVRSLSVPTSQQYSFGAAALLTMVTIGCTLLWPAVRLSQSAPRLPGQAVIGDLIVVLVPVQVIIWPLPVLTHWPWEIAAGLSVMMTSWTLFVAVPLWRALRQNDAVERAITMLLIVAIVALGAGVLGLLRLRGVGGSLPAWLWLSSPVTGVWELVSAPSGLKPRMSQEEWSIVALPVVGALVWSMIALLASWRTNNHQQESFGR